VTIFYVHRGNPFYLKYSLAQTRERFPHAQIVLLGDESNRNLVRFVEYHPLEGYSLAARDFAGQYVHLSPNLVEFELFCIQRWFFVEEFVRLHGVEGPLVYLDSDVLVYENVFEELVQKNMALATTRELGPAFTFFRDPSVLAGLVAFIHRAYTDPTLLSTLRGIFETGVSPFFLQGKYVSDMQLLGLYYRTLTETLDLGTFWPDVAFDYAFHTAEGYSFNPYKRIKRLWWRDGHPYGKRKGSLVRFAGLHFQVGTKIYLPLYYRGSFRFNDLWKYRLIHLRGAVTTALKFILDCGRKWRESK